MLQSNGSDTPVRREELSITRNSLRSRFLRQKSSVPIESSLQHVVNVNCSLTNDTRMSFDEEVNYGSRIPDRVPLIQKDEGGPVRDSGHSRQCDFRMEVSMIQGQKHSTPRVVKISSTAVSSTPNQDLLVGSGLSRHVSTQTNFTLSCDFKEFDEDLQTCLIKDASDIYEEIFIKMPSENSFLGISAERSPLREISGNNQKQIASCHSQAEQIQTTARKLSLRTKTMICNAVENSKGKKTPLKTYTSLEEKRLFHNTYSLMPLQKTPPSFTGKVSYNPFEADMSERLGKTIFSPNVFENVVSPSEDSDCIRWTIEDISSINPVPIDENFCCPSDDEDPVKENQAQEEIDRYFSETHNVLSPCDEQSQCYSAFKDTHNGKASSTPQCNERIDNRQFKNAGTQTMLSLPTWISNKLQDSLVSFFKCYEECDMNLSASTLRRKLFFQSVDEPPSPVRFSSCSSPAIKCSFKFDCSPFNGPNTGRHFTPLSQGHISSPEISPVSPLTKNVTLSNSSLCKKTLNFHLSGGSRAEKTRPEREITMITSSGETNMSLDYESSVITSQDTGYNTAEVSELSPRKPTAASTPSNTRKLLLH